MALSYATYGGNVMAKMGLMGGKARKSRRAHKSRRANKSRKSHSKSRKSHKK